MDKPDKTIGMLHTDVTIALGNYESAKAAEMQASSEATDALNRLNAAQRAFDDAVADLKKSSPVGTDWNKRPSFPAK